MVGGPPAMPRLRVEPRPALPPRGGRVAEPSAVHRHGPAARPVQAEDEPHGGGLPGPVRAEESGDPARLHGERQAVDGEGVAVSLAEAPRLNHSSALLDWPLNGGPPGNAPRSTVVSASPVSPAAQGPVPRRPASGLRSHPGLNFWAG